MPLDLMLCNALKSCCDAETVKPNSSS